MGKRRDRGLRYAVATVLALGVLAAVPAVSGAVPSGGYVKLTLTNSTGAPLVLDQNLTSLAHGYFGNSDGMRQAPPHQFFPGTTITVYVIGNFLFQSKGYLAYAGDGG